jgi:hypothetical protein
MPTAELRGSGRRQRRRGGSGSWLGAAAAAAFGVLTTIGSHAPGQVADDRGFRASLVQVGGEPRIVVLAPVVAEAASETPLMIKLSPNNAVPKNSFLRLRGLPHSASLSEGHSIAPGNWAVPLNGLPRLTLRVPPVVTGRSEIIISLIGEDGALLSEVRVALVILPAATDKGSKGGKAAEPARPQAPAMTPADREAAEKLLARGERDFELGNIAQSRQFFVRAAQAGLARGALMLGATYDPREIARVGAVGVQPNLAEARRWYMRAIELGAPEAAERLTKLGGS